jgi:hypothetical protein
VQRLLAEEYPCEQWAGHFYQAVVRRSPMGMVFTAVY